MYMLMDYITYLNNVCLNLQNVPCGGVLTDLFIEATVYSDYLIGRGRVDITDRLLLNSEIFVSEATRNSLRLKS